MTNYINNATEILNKYGFKQDPSIEVDGDGLYFRNKHNRIGVYLYADRYQIWDKATDEEREGQSLFSLKKELRIQTFMNIKQFITELSNMTNYTMSTIDGFDTDDSWFEFFEEFNEEVDKIAAILKIKRVFVGFSPNLGSWTKAAYYPESNKVFINSYYFSLAMNDLLIMALAHELRHAYQFQKWPQDKMSRILEEYQSGDPDYDEYYLSEIEIDARIFASNYLLYRKNLVDLDTLKTLTVGI